MSAPALVPRAEGEVVGDSPDRRVEILSDHESLHATWSRFSSGREGADLHVHRRHSDLFYVLDGELTLGLGIEDEPVVVPQGTLARVPPLVVHGFRNASDAEVRYLNFHAPGQGFAEYLRALRDGRSFSYDQHAPPPDGGRRPTDAAIGGEEVLSDQPGQRVALLAEVEGIGMVEAWIDPGSPSPPPHVHRRHVESFYVLQGEMRVTAADRELRAEAGSWVQVPPGVPHTVRSPGTAPCASSTFTHRAADWAPSCAASTRQARTTSWLRCGRHSIRFPRRARHLRSLRSRWPIR